MGGKVAFSLLAGFVAIILVVLLVAKSGSEDKKINFCRSDGCKATGELMARFMNREANPCTDFYDYACGRYVFFDQSANFSVQEDLNRKSIKQLKGLLGTSLVRSPIPVQIAATFYKNCIDAAPYYAVTWLEEELQDVGGWPLAATDDSVEEASGDGPDVEPQGKWTDIYVKARADWQSNWVLGVYVEAHPKSKTKYIVKIDLPESDPFWPILTATENKTYADEQIASYKEEIRIAADKMGRKRDAVDLKLLDQVVEFEKKIAELYQESASSSKHDEKFVTLKELGDMSSDKTIPWDKILNDIFQSVNITLPDSEPIWLRNFAYYTKLAELIKNTPIKTFNAYFGWKFIQIFGRHMSELTQNEKGREEQCIAKTYHYYSHALKRMYIEKYFDSASRVRADNIIINLKRYLNDNPTALSMTERDKEMHKRLKRKLDSLTSVIGYEDWISKRDKIEEFYTDISDYNDRKYLGSIVDTYTGRSYKELKKLRQKFRPPVNDPDKPSLIQLDAYYDPKSNQLFYSPGLMQPPIFSVDAPTPINYGAFGSWAACDLVYLFNKNASNFEENQAKRKWWTPKAAMSYAESARCFEEEYNLIIGWLDRTLEDVMAIAEGLRISYEAFLVAIEDRKHVRIPKPIKKLTIEQMFFVSFAQVYCSNGKMEERTVNTILKNFPPFLDTFKCKKPSKLKRCRL